MRRLPSAARSGAIPPGHDESLATPRILQLDEIAGSDRESAVGGKARGLARLLGMGLRVPPGFVILNAVSGSLPEDLLARYRALAPGEDDPAVAVRSSALAEDSAEASFAGQYETVLDVRGEAALRAAVEHCLASLSTRRATAYQQHREAMQRAPGAEQMCVVVQRMVAARAAGVLFTVDPVTGRRARVVIDAVPGLGEKLVSGETSPDHYVLDRSGETLAAACTGARPILSEAERRSLVAEALEAEAHEGVPLDLEWAIDARGETSWLQARPVTNLSADPTALDTIAHPDHVYTRCNVGEMFPGACTPLSLSFTARSIDVGMQRMHQRIGIRGDVGEENRFIAMFHGQLFLDLSAMSETATHALGSSAEQMALSVCGRPITEFEIRASAAPPALRRMANGLRYVCYLLGRGRARREISRLARELRFPEARTASEQWRAIDLRYEAIYAAMDHHLVSSASSGVLTPTLLGVLARGETPGDAHHAEVAGLLAGAGGVESADIVAGAERIQREVLRQPDARERFVDASPADALAWLRGEASGTAGVEFERFLERHGHRAIKELELRQLEWREDPLPLVKSIQLPLRRLPDPSDAAPREAAFVPPAAAVSARRTAWPLRGLTALARDAVRAREETKSALVRVTTHFKRAYRRLGELAVREGLLPDCDALFFLTHQELGRLVQGGERSLAQRALARREIFPSQDALHFPDVFQGEPEPVQPEVAPGQTAVRGAPVSRGRVAGSVRVVRSLDEAESLQAGEILVAPITDVGWTPYFSLIAGLVTDVGSAVSHGAVVAREYGLPAVVNTRVGTSVFRTGDRVVLDGETGVVRLAEADE